jgi:hypothetical protein
MARTFDRRVLPEPVVRFLARCAREFPVHLAGATALSGAYLRHRISRDADLVCHDPHDVPRLAQELPRLCSATGFRWDAIRTSPVFVRGRITCSDLVWELDVTHEVHEIEPPPEPIEGVVVESLADLRASKITRILSRTEPRDLVDLFFLDRAGYPPELDIAPAARKDAGVDPGLLAHLLSNFPVEPLPVMIQPITAEELRAFRDDLAERFRKAALPPPG